MSMSPHTSHRSRYQDSSYLHERSKVRGVVTVLVRDVNTGDTKKVFETENIMTNAGLAEIASHWASPWQMPGGSGYVMEVGSGSGTPQPTDTGMFTPIYPCFQYVSPTVSNNQVQFVATYLPDQCNGYTFSEAGIAFPAQILYTNGVGSGISGTLVDHLTFPVPVQKTSSIYLQIIITFIIV